MKNNNNRKKFICVILGAVLSVYAFGSTSYTLEEIKTSVDILKAEDFWKSVEWLSEKSFDQGLWSFLKCSNVDNYIDLCTFLTQNDSFVEKTPTDPEKKELFESYVAQVLQMLGRLYNRYEDFGFAVFFDHDPEEADENKGWNMLVITFKWMLDGSTEFRSFKFIPKTE